jgi:hypothetical protein
MLREDPNMKLPNKLSDRNTATAGALLRAQIDRRSLMHKIFKTQPFSAAC